MPVLLLALLWLIPTIAAAQTAPVLGLGLGITKQAAPLMETCGGNPRTLPTIELMAGVASGAWRAEARGEAFSALVVNDCLTAGPLYEGGSHTDRAYPFERGHGDNSVSAHLGYAPPNSIWGLGIGAGQLLSAGMPFLVGTSALRTRGRIAGVVELQARFTRLRYDLVTAEWQQFEPIQEVARERNHQWYGTYAIRVRAELRLR